MEPYGDRPPLDAILLHLRSRPQRTWSIVVTVFGDAVAPRGGSIWLGALLDLFAAMDIGGGVVRTAMSRLTADGWLARSRAGRNSFYGLTERGRTSFAEAAARIYGPPPGAWDGVLHLLAPDGEAAPPEGAGCVSPGLWLAPGEVRAPGWLRIEGRADLPTARRLAARAWNLDATAQAYARFVDAFAPLRGWAASGGALRGLDALAARTLLVHEYRRVVLRDPLLPLALLPEPWPGAEARATCAEIYQAALPGSEAWLDAHARVEDGPLPPPSLDLARRFSR